jgi:hypothetical protein
MRIQASIFLFAALVVGVLPVKAILPIVWWRLVEVIDEQTITICSDKGETRTVTLAGVGRAKDKRIGISYIKRRLHDHKVVLHPLETGQTNWYDRPMLVVLDMDLPGHPGSEGVYDFPTLNEELLRYDYVPFAEVEVTGDRYGLKARLLQAKTEGERHRAEREKRWEEYRKRSR